MVSGGDNSLKKGSTAEVTKQGWGVNSRQNGMAFRSAWGSWACLALQADHPIAMIRSVGTGGLINRGAFFGSFLPSDEDNAQTDYLMDGCLFRFSIF